MAPHVGARRHAVFANTSVGAFENLNTNFLGGRHGAFLSSVYTAGGGGPLHGCGGVDERVEKQRFCHTDTSGFSAQLDHVASSDKCAGPDAGGISKSKFYLYRHTCATVNSSSSPRFGHHPTWTLNIHQKKSFILK